MILKFMAESDEKKRLAEEIAKVDSQMVALAKLKQKHLAKLSAPESAESCMTGEERREALANVLAEGIAYLGERGLLSLTDDPVKTPVSSNSSDLHRIKIPNEKRSKSGK